MDIWLVLLVAVAVGGAMSVWNTVAQTKHTSESMLKQYEELLAESRRAMREQMLAEDDDDLSATPPTAMPPSATPMP